ncbi:MAG TPA: hypothetical protein EYG26_00475, partial [Planctomycetes bacterium]|nr:hypothetical protein [Planctomycetota bacterium]
MKIHQLSDTEDQPLKKKSRRIESVSGLHPAPIFVFFALAFVLVAGAALRLCLLEPGEQPNTARRTEAPTPAF